MNKSFTQTYFNFQEINIETLQKAFIDTLYMTFISMLFVLVIGLLLGLLLYSTRRSQKKYAKVLYLLISLCSNIFRSTPFMILMVLIIPFTKMIVGTMLGATAAIPALVFSAAPFYARLVEIAFREVDAGVLEASEAMGASYLQMIWKVLIPESIPALISGLTVTTVSMIGYTAMAGAIGAGGLGGLAWQEGYQLGNLTVTFVATILILMIVFIVQGLGDFFTKRTDKR